MVVDLQHEVHYLNNQLHPILEEEEEDPEMFIEDDSWEEEDKWFSWMRTMLYPTLTASMLTSREAY